MTAEELQKLYNELGAVRKVAEFLGASYTQYSLKKAGVVLGKGGFRKGHSGYWKDKTMPSIVGDNNPSRRLEIRKIHSENRRKLLASGWRSPGRHKVSQ